MKEWTKAIDDIREVDVIYLDFKAAIDKVPHKCPLEKSQQCRHKR